MSKEYSVTVTYVIQFTASGQTQAEERGQEIADAFYLDAKTMGKKWVGDMEQTIVEVEGEE